jgi:hypothetical protein
VKLTAPRGTLSFNRTDGGWRAGRSVIPPGWKRPGSEGPLAEVAAARHIYVYGTLDSPPPEEALRRRQIATEAAQWSTPRTPLLVHFQVLADRNVREADIAASNLILFGTRETNSLIARFADRLPVSLNPGAADYGLLFIAPIGDRYVAVNSGVPFWTGADDTERFGNRLLPPVWRVLANAKDYLLFRGSLENILAEGYFDQRWRINTADAAKLTSSGVVLINSTGR